MQNHAIVTNNPKILVAEDTTGLFLAHTMSTTVSLETTACQPYPGNQGDRSTTIRNTAGHCRRGKEISEVSLLSN